MLVESIVGDPFVVSRELGSRIKIPPWGLNYILPSFVCLIFPLEIFIPPCVGVSG